MSDTSKPSSFINISRNNNISYYYFLPYICHYSFYHNKKIIVETYLQSDFMPEFNNTHFFLIVRDVEGMDDLLQELRSSFNTFEIKIKHKLPAEYLDIYPTDEHYWFVGVELNNAEQKDLANIIKGKYGSVRSEFKQKVLKNTVDTKTKNIKNKVFNPTFEDRFELATFLNVPVKTISDIFMSPKLEDETFKIYW